jgi:1,4-alpha-glucan branching enzyme
MSIMRYDYQLGVPEPGFYREIINTDAETFGGSNVGGKLRWRPQRRSRMDGPRTFHRHSLAALGDPSVQAGKVIR